MMYGGFLIIWTTLPMDMKYILHLTFQKKFDIIEDHIAIREHPRPVKNKARQRPVQKHVNWHAYL